MSAYYELLRRSLLVGLMAGATGCMHSGWCRTAPECNVCPEPAVSATACPSCGVPSCRGCSSGKLRYTVGQCWSDIEYGLFGWACKKSNAIPETLPLGSTVRSHIQVMETNGEAADFIIHQHDFVGQTAELTPDGKDHILEIAARMRSAPFPVVVERTDNNADPELDALRRNLVAQILTDLGNPDAQQRTVVSTAYGPGYVGTRAEQMYYQHIYRGGMGAGNFGAGGGGFGTGAAAGGSFLGGGFF